MSKKSKKVESSFLDVAAARREIGRRGIANPRMRIVIFNKQ